DHLYEAYLKHYPNGAFADAAKTKLEEFRIAALKPAVDPPDDKAIIGDPALLREVRDRLYELNFDPGSIDGPMDDAARRAIREFEQMSKLPETGQVTHGLLRRLRTTESPRPWGAIVYGKGGNKWGMAWTQGSRKEAIAGARASCGQSGQCSVELS